MTFSYQFIIKIIMLMIMMMMIIMIMIIEINARWHDESRNRLITLRKKEKEGREK